MENPTETQKKESTDTKLYWVLGAMAGIFFLFFALSYFFQGLNNFEYQGLSFTKEYLGEIPLYRYSYNSVTGSAIQEAAPVTLLLRHDPRENNVPIDGEIEFFRGKFVYLGINAEGLSQCPYSTLSIATLSSFISSNGFTSRAGTVNQTEAAEQNLTHVTCEGHPNNPVLIIQAGDESKITKDGNCYTLQAANCEILQVVEKFEVQSIIDAKSRASQ